FVESSMPQIKSMPASRAGAIAWSCPANVSWSVMPRTSTPPRTALAINCAGEQVPSDSLVCECRSIKANQTQVFQCSPDSLDAFGGSFPRRVDRHFGRERRLVGVGNTGEMRNLACHCLPVKAFYIALRQDFDRTLHVDFDEVPNTGP